MARHVHNDRLRDALDGQALAALSASPGARAYYDQLRARGAGHRAGRMVRKVARAGISKPVSLHTSLGAYQLNRADQDVLR